MGLVETMVFAADPSLGEAVVLLGAGSGASPLHNIRMETKKKYH